MNFLPPQVTADAEGGLKIRAHLRPDLQGFGGDSHQQAERRVYTGALLAATYSTASIAPHNFIFNQGNKFTWTHIQRICNLPL